MHARLQFEHWSCPYGASLMSETFLDRTRRSDASIGAAQKLLTRTVGLLAHSLGPIASTPVRSCSSASKRLAHHALAPVHRSPAQIMLVGAHVALGCG
jgi:hypothetical protein